MKKNSHLKTHSKVVQKNSTVRAAQTVKKTVKQNPIVTKTITRPDKKLLQKPQTILGIIILICLILLSAISVLRAVTTDVRSLEPMPPTAPPSTVLSGIVLDPLLIASSSAAAATASAQSATSTAQPATPSTTPQPAIAAQPVKLQVKKDQTFWEFAKRYCGSHTFAERLAHNNGYRRVTDLKEGDWITISCR